MKFLISIGLIWASFHFGGLKIGGAVTAIIFFWTVRQAIKQVYSPMVRDKKTGEAYFIWDFRDMVANDPAFADHRIKLDFGVGFIGSFFTQTLKLDISEFDNHFMRMLHAKLVLAGGYSVAE